MVWNPYLYKTKTKHLTRPPTPPLFTFEKKNKECERTASDLKIETILPKPTPQPEKVEILPERKEEPPKITTPDLEKLARPPIKVCHVKAQPLSVSKMVLPEFKNESTKKGEGNQVDEIIKKQLSVINATPTLSLSSFGGPTSPRILGQAIETPSPRNPRDLGVLTKSPLLDVPQSQVAPKSSHVKLEKFDSESSLESPEEMGDTNDSSLRS
ncbi:hypothetical protein EIN_275270 [Entamoeba invadens IP1]|uniref:Uncharacterized protein n=1 Tax=Entamoeba invadens IP1 TaxID=370355 RepID=A0A0A1U1P2_ENTIV|nr:hypothetical protein EIN_275270 [Entamoeba invadens IP1]ELP87940.1 hypothetical protein EIN_275270 [Entamoeba invadens IP1]|eukprot:XP_004254711.1 hypothetical protein EIN_275270 [Entamoeba invadens IP1]